ncbi:MAG: TolC family protein [Tannerella sp.]|jgi:outer membrane protein|nr:TolC family protein [Tannerella sp.]
MKRTIKRLLLTASLFQTLCLSAGTRQPWTLEACIRHALEHNIQLKLHEQEQAAREIELHTSRNSWLPSLNAGIGQNLDFGRSPSKDGLIVDRNSANSSASLQMNMPVFDGFRIPNDIAARRFNLRAAVEALNKAREDLAVGVASFFLQVLYNKEIRLIAELQLALTTEQVRKTEALVNAGKAPASQLYDIRAQQAKDEATLTEARNNVSLALLDLAQSLELEHFDSDFDISAPATADPVAELAAGLLPPEHIYQSAVVLKPQIKEQEYLLESQKKVLKTAQSGYYPKLTLNASYGNGYYRYAGSEDLVNIPFGDQLRQNERKTVGLTLTIPIFNRFEVRNSVRSARVAILNRELMMENAKKVLYKEIQQAYFNATAAQEQYIASAKAVEAGREAFTCAEERYSAGKSSVFEYGEAKTKYAQSLSQQAQAKYNFIFRAKILDFYNGRPITL